MRSNPSSPNRSDLPSAKTSAALGLPALLLLLVTGLLSYGFTSATAVSSDDKLNFATDVWPIIEGSCLECHDSGTAFSNLRLDSPEKIMAGGDLGKVVVAGEPDESPLVLRVALPEDDLDFMPIEGDALTEEQIATLRKWITEGADFGDWKGVE